MLKRTKGRLLLTLLVITGLAGTLNDSSISQQERKLVLTRLKESKSTLLESVKELTPGQLRFRPGAGEKNIEEYLHAAALADRDRWKEFEAVMKMPVTPEKRQQIHMSDEEVLALAQAEIAAAPVKKVTPALESIALFKSARTTQVKYVKSTTEDLRNHVFHTPQGTMDGYQYLLYLAGGSLHVAEKINDIKMNPRFPKQ